jgi:GntR family transcriptional regulator
MAPDEQLLSVRQLARLMGINPNTIAKAYWELEKSKIIYSVGGKGSFISPDLSVASLDRKNEVKTKLKEQIVDAKNVGIDKQSVIEIVTCVYQTNSEVGNL